MCHEVKQIYANFNNIKLLLGIKFGSVGQEEDYGQIPIDQKGIQSFSLCCVPGAWVRASIFSLLILQLPLRWITVTTDDRVKTQESLLCPKVITSDTVQWWDRAMQFVSGRKQQSRWRWCSGPGTPRTRLTQQPELVQLFVRPVFLALSQEHP